MLNMHRPSSSTDRTTSRRLADSPTRRLASWLLLLVVALPAVQPLLGGRLPWSADGLLHFHRLAQLHRSLRHGVLFPRWAPDMGFGFGFPLFNYYAPLSYYLAEPFILIGLSTQDALVAAFILATFAACIGAYLCGRDLFGPRAGFVAAFAFIYAPYNLYNVVHRGALAEAWGLAWLPFIFWAMRRLALRGRRTDLVVTGLFYAALMLTHNILALIATPLLILYALVLWGLHGRGRQRALLMGGALALGLGLTAFFWIPALFEMKYVQIHQLYAPADLDYHNNFASLGQLLAAPQPVDPALINPPVPRSFGWPQLALALIALCGPLLDAIGSRSPGREARCHIAPGRRAIGMAVSALGRSSSAPGRSSSALGLGLIALTLLMLPCSVGVWDNLPLLRFVQFPWRFLGPADLFLALLAGAGATRLLPKTRPPSKKISHCSLFIGHWSFVIVHCSFLLLITFALTWLFPHYYPPQPEPTPLTLIAFEQDTGALGTTSAGDYLPVWVRRLPPADSLVPAYEQAGPDAIIPRLDPGCLPAGSQIVEAHYDLTTADLVIDAPSGFTAIFNWYFFPGWVGWLDGQPLALRPSGEHGLIGADIPAGRHHLTIRFGDTALRRWATLASALSLAALLLTLLIPSPPPQLADSPTRRLATPSDAFGPHSLFPSALVALAILTLKTTYLDHHDTLFRHSRFDGQSVADVQVPLQVNFDDQFILMGYDLHASPAVEDNQQIETVRVRTPSVRADGLLELALYWRAARPLDTDYSIAAHLVDDQGRRYGQRDSQHPAGYPTSRWETDTYARDLHRLAVWPGTPPGEYTLLVGVYDVTTGRSLDVRDPAGVPVGTTYAIASVQVTHPSRLPNPDSIDIGHRLQADLDGGLRLLGFDPPPTEVNAGDHLPLTLYWQALAAPADDADTAIPMARRPYAARLSLVAPDGAVVAETSATPGRPSYPTSAWHAGDVVRDGHSFLVPAATPAGEYTLYVDLLPSESANQRVSESASRRISEVELLTITVHAPERTFDPPLVQYPISATLDGQATLLGYDLHSDTLTPGQTFTLTLYWRAKATAETGYVVFVHLLDEAERIYAQSDRVPAADTRPTTGWLTGEVIHDAHTLTLASGAPPGQYVLEVGMYDPASGERLPALDEHSADAGDRILLPIRLSVFPSVDAPP